MIEIKFAFKKLCHFLILVTLLVVISLISSCGGGDDPWGILPLWVPTDVVVTDINNDGKNEIFSLSHLVKESNQEEGHLYVYKQTSQGTFSTPIDYSIGTSPWQLLVGDMNADDLPDILITESNSSGAWTILQDSNNIGQFLSAQKVNTGNYYSALDDINDDGNLEIATLSNDKVTFYIFPNNQNTPLADSEFDLQNTPSYIATGDLNRDNLNDLLLWIDLPKIGYTPNGVLGVSFQQPDGTFGPVTTLTSQKGLNVEYMTIADYNGDGANDIFVRYSPFSDEYNAKITVFCQNPQSGTFSNSVDTSLSKYAVEDSIIADLNNDGLPELAVVESGNKKIDVFSQTGDGTFAIKDSYSLPIYSSCITAGDVDGDGLNDLVVVGDENKCYVLTQSSTNIGTFNPAELISQ
jgi:hypothetical protein